MGGRPAAEARVVRPPRTQLEGAVLADFPVTREVIARLRGWVEAFAALLPPPVQVRFSATSVRWEHDEKNAQTLQVAKAVRIASGLHAAMALADLRHTVECTTLLRTVSDFCSEITFLGEGLAEGRLTAEQQKFLEQQFTPFASTPEELASRDKERYVGRGAVGKAHGRLAEKAGVDKDLLFSVTEYLNKAYDSYVHGYYATAMELYTGRTMSFMLAGHESERHVCMAKAGVAGKLKEALNAFRMMAINRATPDLDQEIRNAFDSIEKSGEDSALPCRGLV